MPDNKDRKEEERQEFKVVDRRLFTSEGELRKDLPPPPPTPPPTSPRGEPQPPPVAESGARGPVQFEHLIMSLVSTAMYQLGMAARPGEIAPPADLPAARETIDLLGVLQEKTKGNLTREEDQLLSGSLQELRLVFVEISRRSGRMP